VTPNPTNDPRRVFTLETMPGDLCEGLLALTDQYEAEAQADAGQGEHGVLVPPAPSASTPHQDS